MNKKMLFNIVYHVYKKQMKQKGRDDPALLK